MPRNISFVKDNLKLSMSQHSRHSPLMDAQLTSQRSHLLSPKFSLEGFRITFNNFKFSPHGLNPQRVAGYHRVT
jgi:hypothetical protein